MRLRRYPASILALLVALFSAAAARASLIVELPLADMVSRAEHIALADVVSVTSAWDARHERIVSTIVLDVVETWKGGAAPRSRVTVVQNGGTVGDISQIVFGQPRFKVGERTLVFLGGSAQAARVIGMAQGKRPVLRDQQSGRWMVHVPDRAGAHFVRRVPQSGAAPATVPAPRAVVPVPLEDLRAEVQGLVGTHR